MFGRSPLCMNLISVALVSERQDGCAREGVIG